MEQLIFNDKFQISTKLEIAIDRIKMFEPPEGYYLAFSGGKDSIVCYELLKLANVKFDAHYNWTSVDPPELKKFIKLNYPDVIIHNPERTMWQLIVDHSIPPTRVSRYCCQELKERGGNNRFVITGVRWAESKKRKSNRKLIEFDSYGSNSRKANLNRLIFLNSDNHEKRKMIESCIIKGKNILNPIIDWYDYEIWNFIKNHNLQYPILYDLGFKRVGCIGCPLQNTKGMLNDFEFYPKYKDNYIKAFDRMLKHRLENGLKTEWKTSTEVFEWWLNK